MLTDNERRLLKDFAVTGFVLLCDFPGPEIITDLKRRRLLDWHWNGGIATYEVTEAGRAAISAAA